MTPKRGHEPSGAAPGGGAAEGAPFEAMMEKLEALVTRLEQGNLSLEESIHAFEEGIALVRKCTAVLNEAEQRVQRLTRDASGAARAEPIEEAEPEGEGRSDELPF